MRVHFAGQAEGAQERGWDAVLVGWWCLPIDSCVYVCTLGCRRRLAVDGLVAIRSID